MKILKIVLIVLVPTLILVGCEKSHIKPGGCTRGEDSVKATTVEAEKDAPTTAGKSSKDVKEDNEDPEDIIGSGDDDREGGDKKQKKNGGK